MKRYLFPAAALWAAFCLSAYAQQPSGIYNATPPTLSDKQQAPFQFDSAGNLKTNTSGAPLPAGTNTIGKVDQGVQGTVGSPWFVQDTSLPTSGTGGVSAVTVGVASAQASAAATRTARLVVKNESTTASIACNLGGTATLNTAGNFTIVPGQMLTLSDPVYVPGDALNCIASAASTPATVWSK